MKQIEAIIMGQNYLLTCPDGGEANMQNAVKKVDTAMCKIRDAAKIKARERIAVLAALNLAFDHSDANHHQPTNGTSQSAASESELCALIQKLDTALAQDGQLL